MDLFVCMLVGICIITLGLIGYMISTKFAEQNTKITTMFGLVNNVIQDVQMIKIQHTVDKISNDPGHSVSTGGEHTSYIKCAPQVQPVFTQIVVSDDETSVGGFEHKNVDIFGKYITSAKDIPYSEVDSGNESDIDSDNESDHESELGENDHESELGESDKDSDNEKYKSYSISLSATMDIFPETTDTEIDIIPPSTQEIRTIIYPSEEVIPSLHTTEIEEVIKSPPEEVIYDVIDIQQDTIKVNIGSDVPDYSKLDVTQLRKLVSEKNPSINPAKLKKKELINILTI